MYKIITTLFLISLFTGCSMVKTSDDSFKFKYFQSTSTTNFAALTENLLKDICPTMKKIKASGKSLSPIYVTDFVNLEDLENNSKLGFILSDSLKTNVTQDCDWPIKEVEFTKYLSLGRNGTKLLSRNVSYIKDGSLNQDTYALVGTYIITQRQLMIYLKLINLKNGVILKSSSKRLSLTDEIKSLELDGDKGTPIYQPMVL